MFPEVFLVERAKYCETAELTCSCIFYLSSLFWQRLYKRMMNTLSKTKKRTMKIKTLRETPPPVTPSGVPMSSLKARQ